MLVGRSSAMGSRGGCLFFYKAGNVIHPVYQRRLQVRRRFVHEGLAGCALREDGRPSDKKIQLGLVVLLDLFVVFTFITVTFGRRLGVWLVLRVGMFEAGVGTGVEVEAGVGTGVEVEAGVGAAFEVEAAFVTAVGTWPKAQVRAVHGALGWAVGLVLAEVYACRSVEL
eukprot:1392128-Amorphochlora_amoeboformis.AAC.1